jgi:hypothetical protein
MNDEFPFLIGRVALTDGWSIELPVACKQRFEESQMVLWRPGFTIWLSIWGHDTKASVQQRQRQFADAASTGKFDESVVQKDGRCYYSYRIDEASDDQRVAAFQGFAFAGHGHVQVSIYFDEEADARLATRVLHSTGPQPPDLEDVSVLSKACFATNMVMEDGCAVGYMYREEPDSLTDSGWRFFSGQESQEYVDNPSNTSVYPVAFVAQHDLSIIPYLSSPNGHFGRHGERFCLE